jgi:hypothetical protein
MVDKKTETIDKQETPGPSSCPQKQASVFNFVKRSSLEEIIAKLAALDGLCINSITTSLFIRDLPSVFGMNHSASHSRLSTVSCEATNS